MTARARLQCFRPDGHLEAEIFLGENEILAVLGDPQAAREAIHALAADPFTSSATASSPPSSRPC